MTPEQIKEKIDCNNQTIELLFSPNSFILNNAVRDLLAENAELQSQCHHEFENGYCKYCYKKEVE